MLIVFVVGSHPCFKGFSPGFPSSTKTNISKFQFNLETMDNESLLGNATGMSHSFVILLLLATQCLSRSGVRFTKSNCVVYCFLTKIYCYSKNRLLFRNNTKDMYLNLGRLQKSGSMTQACTQSPIKPKSAAFTITPSCLQGNKLFFFSFHWACSSIIQKRYNCSEQTTLF